ncbi:chain-length determining protein [Brevundimonas naejangsanensis]|uniref:Chain-length determining protein n=1 Tax=Brevundimonas naejangsanensis TaxID=588932 RepID=A0A494RFS0_9CAUL|nr:chain-length determining protein [Brevundimonas naejangsanensis]
MSGDLRYIGPVPGSVETRKDWRSRVRKHLPFLLIVALPTVVGALYWGVIATPRYVSESHFVVRKVNEARPSNLGMVLQGVGVSTGTSDAFTVQEYLVSRDAAETLDRKFDLDKVLSAHGADLFSRYPRPFQPASSEGRFEALKRFVVVGYNATTGITTLRVQAFSAREAQAMNRTLLDSGEELVNRLNERAARDAVKDAEAAVVQATARRAQVQQQMAAFRDREGFLDPQLVAGESTQVISGLLRALAELKAELAQIQQSAPQSPQIPILRGRIASYETQVEQERAKLTGRAGSLAPKIAAYESLALQREVAEKALLQASAALLTAEQDARRQKLYLDRIVEPNLADQPMEPRRLRAFLIVFLSSLALYLLGRLLWAGLREHRQE